MFSGAVANLSGCRPFCKLRNFSSRSSTEISNTSSLLDAQARQMVGTSLSLSLSLSFPETKASVRILRCRYTSHPGSLFSFTISLSSRGIHPMHMHIEEAATYSPNKSNRAHSFLPATMKPKTGSRFREREEEEEEEEEEEGRHKRKR